MFTRIKKKIEDTNKQLYKEEFIQLLEYVTNTEIRDFIISSYLEVSSTGTITKTICDYTTTFLCTKPPTKKQFKVSFQIEDDQIKKINAKFMDEFEQTKSKDVSYDGEFIFVLTSEFMKGPNQENLLCDIMDIYRNDQLIKRKEVSSTYNSYENHVVKKIETYYGINESAVRRTCSVIVENCFPIEYYSKCNTISPIPFYTRGKENSISKTDSLFLIGSITEKEFTDYIEKWRDKNIGTTDLENDKTSELEKALAKYW